MTSPPSRPLVGARFPEGWQDRVPSEWLEGWSPQTFDLGDGTTEVVTMGEGPTLLLLPPLPGFKEGFLAVARGLARRYRVVTFDLRVRFAGTPTWDALVARLDTQQVLDLICTVSAYDTLARIFNSLEVDIDDDIGELIGRYDELF